jgi:hypothetical protein
MKRTASLAAVLLAAAAALLPGRAAAAVSTTLAIGIRADRSEFVRGEDLTISGVLRNTGSSAFIVDDYGPYLQNRIRLYLRDAATGRLIDPRPGAPASAVPSLTVRPGEEKPFTIHVGTCYDLPRHARVQATAVVERGDDESAASHPVAFTLVEGIEFTSDVRTLPGDDRRLFRFELIYWARDQVENIFLRVSDPAQDGRVVGFASLGTVVRVAEPSMTFDAKGVVTIVNQISRDRFAKTRIDASSFPLRILERNANLLSADAVSERIATQLVSERVDAQKSEKTEESRGLFSRHRTRIPAAPEAPAPAR